MSSLYRDLSDAAFKGKLNKNQLLVFNALVYQTLGFGKTHDPLTDKRLFKLTGIRVDRLRPAIKAVIDKGLFDRKPHKRYQYEYSIGETFLEAHQDNVYTPSIPKKRSPSENENGLTQTGQNPPEKATHTITNQTLSNLQQPQTSQTKKHMLTQQQQTNTETQTVTLFFAEQEHIPNHFAIEASANTRIEFAIGDQSHSAATTDTADIASKPEPSDNASIAPPATTTRDNIAKLRKLLALAHKAPKPATHHVDNATDNTEKTTATDNPIETIITPLADTAEPKPSIAPIITPVADTPEPNPSIEPMTTPFADTPKSSQQPAPSKAVPLPKVLANKTVCQNNFKRLTSEQQKDVVLAFDYAVKTGTVNNVVGYFIKLTHSAIDGSLTVPTEAIVHADTPPSAEKLAADQARQRHHELWSDFTWLRDNAALQGIDMQTLAQQMDAGMQEAYAMFAGQV